MGTSSGADQVPSALGIAVTADSSSNGLTLAAMAAMALLIDAADGSTNETTTFGNPAESPGIARHPVPLKVTVLPATTGFGVTVNEGAAAAAADPPDMTSGTAASTATATRLTKRFTGLPRFERDGESEWVRFRRVGPPLRQTRMC